jgi:hypothetical protein
MEHPIGIPTTFLAYMTRKTAVARDLAMTRRWLANSRDATPIRHYFPKYHEINVVDGEL